MAVTDLAVTMKTKALGARVTDNWECGQIQPHNINFHLTLDTAKLVVAIE